MLSNIRSTGQAQSRSDGRRVSKRRRVARLGSGVPPRRWDRHYVARGRCRTRALGLIAFHRLHRTPVESSLVLSLVTVPTYRSRVSAVRTSSCGQPSTQAKTLGEDDAVRRKPIVAVATMMLALCGCSNSDEGIVTPSAPPGAPITGVGGIHLTVPSQVRTATAGGPEDARDSAGGHARSGQPAGASWARD